MLTILHSLRGPGKVYLGSAEPRASSRDEWEAGAAGVRVERQGWIAGGVRCRVSKSTVARSGGAVGRSCSVVLSRNHHSVSLWIL